MSRTVGLALAALVVAAACAEAQRGSLSVSPGRSPSAVASSVAASSSPSSASTPTGLSSIPVGVAGTMFVLVDRYNAGDASRYKLALVGIDGRQIKVLTPDEPSVDQNGQSLAAPPVVSISNTRVYYLDGDTSVGFLSPDGSTGLAATLPGGPQKLVSFAVSPDDSRIAYAIFDYTSGGPAVSITVQDLAGGGNKVSLYSSPTNAEWPVAWVRGNVVMAIGASQVAEPSGVSPFTVANPYNATNGYQLIDSTNGQVLDTIPSECAFGLLVAGGTPCARDGGGVCVRDWSGTINWYANSAEANFSMREALSTNGTIAANSSPGSVGLFSNGTKIDYISAINGNAVAMGWVDASHLVVRHFNGSSTVTVVDTKAGTTIDVAINCGPSTAPVRCTDAVMFGTL